MCDYIPKERCLAKFEILSLCFNEIFWLMSRITVRYSNYIPKERCPAKDEILSLVLMKTCEKRVNDGKVR